MALRPKVLWMYIGLPILGICAATLYYLQKRSDSDWEEFGMSIARSNVIEVKVPTESVGLVIGRAGANIKEIQDKTSTKINFKDSKPDENFRICRIRGTPEGTQLAEALIHEAIANQPVIETLEIWVPQKACGRIIGRCGDTIRAISKQSNAQIVVDKTIKGDGDKKQVIIKGTAEQIAVAKSLIDEKVEEDDIARNKMHLSLLSRSPRHKSKQNKQPEAEERRYERLVATNNDSMIQVYVSSVATPTHFWLQLISPKAVDLDHLVDEMTEYYNNEDNRVLHKLKEVMKGQIVASRFEHDDKWYRVEVCSIEEDNENPDENVIDVFYVDYGDSAYQKLGELYQLRTDFLSLRFQAIECSMSGIKPKGSDEWTEESISTFEDMCYTAQWKAMMAQVVGYKERERSHREGSPVPCVLLYDPSGPQGIDIGKELVQRGLADTDIEENVTPTLDKSETKDEDETI